MRQIKFRVFSHSTQKFLEAGDKLFKRYTELYYGLEFFEGNEIFINYFQENNPDKISGQKIKGAFAINQFTGIKDCNGCEIYEGDIVKFDDGEIAEVVFFCGAFMPKLEKGRGISIQYDAKPIWQDGEVIGNIHENSELLGGKNE